ncbi:MAG: serine/threonine protein kinase [Sandaracinaceae bacterium]|nr:serine/threonine protein kinase [Sandaracinaceae bacterium]
MVAPSTHSASRDTPLRPKLPLRLGRFTLCEELGAGGMATVYLARMELAAGLDRLVALKTIHPHLARERAFVDMFLDEARIASHVSHPNVCAVHDFGEVGGVYYLAMEHLIGEPLFDVINRLVDRFDDVREVLPFIAARVIADGCEGLHAAHTARGPDGTRLHIVHRDVSPQNLFVTYDGAVKVVDFGCAKAAQRVAHTSTGVMKGKVGYAAPEQLRADEVDARADVWALGVCLWEALTLSPLFTKATAMKTAMSVLEDDVPLACDDRSWIPEQVAKIAGKALTRDRDRRYTSARDMGRDLRKFIADSGYTLEAAELAEWMDFLFDDRHEERERQARRVREMDVSDVAVALPEMLGEVAAEDVVLLPDSTSAMEAIAAAERGEIVRSEPPPALPEPRDPAPETPPPRASSPAPAPRRRASRWPVVILLLLALSAGATCSTSTTSPRRGCSISSAARRATRAAWCPIRPRSPAAKEKRPRRTRARASAPRRATRAPRRPRPIRRAPIRRAPTRRAPIRRAPIRRAPIRRAPIRRAPIHPPRPPERARSRARRPGARARASAAAS